MVIKDVCIVILHGITLILIRILFIVKGVICIVVLSIIKQ
jgi:hypothetical protein